jgi:uncharacterized protein YjbJ (UPF0337 family)
MDKDRISGTANKAKGAVKDAVGSATGSYAGIWVTR